MSRILVFIAYDRDKDSFAHMNWIDEMYFEKQ